MQQELQQPPTSLLSTCEISFSSAPHIDIKQRGMESDDELRTEPDFGSGPSTTSGPDRTQPAGQRKRGRSPADTEHKRLKRLLRNRVSAQQARERKKAYVGELETNVKELERRNSELEERLSTLKNENQMLRHILKNTTVGRRGSTSSSSGDGQWDQI